MKTSTLQPTDAMLSAGKAVLATMALVETVKPVVIGLQTKLLEEGKYKYSSEFSERARGNGEYITDPKHAYLMSDEDFKKYFDLLDDEIQKAGFDVKKGYCPLLVAEHELVTAKRSLIIAMESLITPVTGLTYEMVSTSKGCVRNIDKLVDLTLNFLVPYINTKAVV